MIFKIPARQFAALLSTSQHGKFISVERSWAAIGRQAPSAGSGGAG